MSYFPRADQVESFGSAFLKLMFAYAELERRVAALQEIVTGKAGFSEKNQWGAHEWSKRMKELIRHNSKRFALMPTEEVKRIGEALTRAIPSCDLRNLLTHGHWWELDLDTQTMKVRREKLRYGEGRYEVVAFSKITDAESQLTDIEVELYGLQQEIEKHILEDDDGPGSGRSWWQKLCSFLPLRPARP